MQKPKDKSILLRHVAPDLHWKIKDQAHHEGKTMEQYILCSVIAFKPMYDALTALRSFMWSEGYADQSAAMAKADAALKLAERGK